MAVALVFFAATSLVAAATAVAVATALVAAAVAAFAMPARHAKLLALAAVVVLGRFLHLAIVVADRDHPFMAAALRAATAGIAAAI
jgi:hypothetical protein